jgi:hypothetical protein
MASTSKRRTTMAKMERERAVREKRARKQEKREEKKAAAAAAALGEDGLEPDEDAPPQVDEETAASA